ncbi:MAG TPA: histidine--tRNA ligase [Bacteroidia bacterium]|nr:histidine--tRNA ligase [Bacteroidia bacterium]
MPLKPSLPKGTRDFSPAEMQRRNLITSVIAGVYHKFGFEQIETPAMENLTTLTGKYGEEGDQLLFRILNSRLNESKNKSGIADAFQVMLDKGTNSELLTERALRYDLTVPFARYVVMHQNDITFPFKRYQIQPVWRADRPQKGRYREFVQCDADIIGSNSLLNEAELVTIIDEVFQLLGIPVSILVNNRKILEGIAEISGVPENIIDITIALDKLDKIGIDKVIEELKSKGLSDAAVEKIKPILTFKGSATEKIAFLKSLLAGSATGLTGIAELEKVMALAGSPSVEPDITLARGLNYYTGAIFEVKAKNVQIGSIAGGGRYDNLTGIFGMEDVSGVGISFGIDRIYDVMEELQLFAIEHLQGHSSRLLFVNFGEEEQSYCLPLLKQVRSAGIAAELFPDAVKMKKQLAYANAKHIPFVALAGSDEMNSNKITLKNMRNGEQDIIEITALLPWLQGKLYNNE